MPKALLVFVKNAFKAASAMGFRAAMYVLSDEEMPLAGLMRLPAGHVPLTGAYGEIARASRVSGVGAALDKVAATATATHVCMRVGIFEARTSRQEDITQHCTAQQETQSKTRYRSSSVLI